METKINLLEPLLERAGEYGKKSIQLLKLKSLDKTAEIVSTLASRSLLTLAIVLFLLTLNIAISLWLGDMLGKYYYGFLVVASCHAFAAVILLIIHPYIKSRVNNSIIRKYID